MGGASPGWGQVKRPEKLKNGLSGGGERPNCVGSEFSESFRWFGLAPE